MCFQPKKRYQDSENFNYRLKTSGAGREWSLPLAAYVVNSQTNETTAERGSMYLATIRGGWVEAMQTTCDERILLSCAYYYLTFILSLCGCCSSCWRQIDAA